MPIRAETIRGYAELMHAQWLQEQISRLLGKQATLGQVQIELRYRYNPGFESLVAMVPAIIPLLLLMIPAILATLAVVREKELGSIVNFYVTPVTRLEFLLGKQIPYVALSMGSFFLLTAFGTSCFPRAIHGKSRHLHPRCSALCYHNDWHRTAGIGVHSQPGGRSDRHHHYKHDTCRALLGTYRSGFLPFRGRSSRSARFIPRHSS